MSTWSKNCKKDQPAGSKGMARNLVFIRHSQTQPEPGVATREWQLTAEGHRRCIPLAAQLAAFNLDRIVTSTERKAIETGQLAAHKLGIPWWAADGLYEHKRETAPYFHTINEFQEAIHALLTRPAERVFGEETAGQARARFTKAVRGVMQSNPHENIGIVTHGTVLSLFVSPLTGEEIFTFWQSLGMPAIVAFLHPSMELLAQVNEIF
ncbi:MAG: histidine phosphatase family protein [Anaerolineales bacterium]